MIIDTTDFEKRKIDMTELWKKTFHDCDRYVDLVFDTYYSIDNTFVRYHENRLIAAMLTVGYEFQILTKEGKKEQFRGIYLCGLATHPEWRKRGIMAELMKEAEDSARGRGYDMAFLIPANDQLREYYGRKGYHTSSWRMLETFKCYGGDSEKAKDLHIYSVKGFREKGKRDFLEKLADWCQEKELSRRYDTIVHSQRDMLTVMEENENTIFITDESFDPEYPSLAKVVAVVFPELSECPEDPLRVVGLYERSEDEEKGCYKSGVDFPDAYSVYNIRKAILEKFHAAEMQILMPVHDRNLEQGGTSPYAMIKPLDKKANSLKIENRAIEICLMLD